MSTKKDSNVTKLHNCDNVSIAVEAIRSAMRRKGLGLGDMYHAVNRLIDEAVADTIVRMRSEGRSIREIARTVHMDDKRVSKLIKAAQIRKVSDVKKALPAKAETKSRKTIKK